MRLPKIDPGRLGLEPSLLDNRRWQGMPRDLAEVERRDWELFLMFFLVTLALLIAFILNHIPGLLEPVEWVVKPAELELFVDGLSIIVLLFALYVLQKHRELVTVRAQLVEAQLQREGLTQRIGIIEALFEVSNAVAGRAGESSQLNGVLDRVRRLLDSDTAYLWEADRSADRLVLRAVTGDDRWTEGDGIGIGEGAAGWVITHGAPLLIAGNTPPELAGSLMSAEAESGSSVFVPLRIEDRVRGVLGVGAHDPFRSFDENDSKLLQVFGNALAASLTAGDLITELQQTLRRVEDQQVQLVQAEKLAGLGELMAGISHELNNPLAVVAGHAELLLMDEELGSPIRERLEKMQHQARRAKQLVENLLRVARGEEARHEPSDFNAVVQQSLALQQYLLDQEGVRVETDLAPDLPTIPLDPFQVQQLVFNLVNNARQAMAEVAREERVLEVHTRVDAVGDQDPEQLNDAVVLTLRDSGPGILLDHLGRVFDPFFTTRQGAGGTGLGLSICRRIVEQHGGRIEVSNHPGGGALFAVAFPTDGPGGAPVVSPLPDLRTAKEVPGGRILVVDDEPGIRELVEEMLGLAGHHTILVRDGREALEHLDTDPAPDVIVLDLKMPVMDGQQFYEHLVHHHPELVERVLFLTGDTLSREARTFIESTGRPCLSKPFTFNDLTDRIAALLEGSD